MVKVKKNGFIYAIIITLLLYTFVFSSNLIIDDYRIKYLKELLVEQDNSFKSNSLTIEHLNYIDIHSNNSCEIQKSAINSSYRTLIKSLEKHKQISSKMFNLSYYDSDSYLKKSYNHKFNLLLLTNEFNNNCDPDKKILFYFFNSTKQTFDRQAIILEQFSLNHDDLIVIPLEVSFKEKHPLIEFEISKYNYTHLPFMVLENITLKYKDELYSIDELTHFYNTLS